MSDTAIRELEWFDLETRLREIIYQQFEIFNKKAREDRESHSQLSTNVQGIEKRILLIEGCLFGEAAPQSALGDLQKKISDIEGARKRDMVRFDQEVISFKEKFKTVNFQISGNGDQIKRLEGIQDDLAKEILKVKEMAEEHQVLILAEIDKITKHFKEMNTNYLDKGLKLEEKMNATSARLDDVGLGLSKYDRQFEGIKKNLNDIYISINLLKTNKLEFETYETERVKTEAKLNELHKDTTDFRNYFVVRDNFLDKFIPLQTHNLISDTLHSCLDPFSKKRLAEYENACLKQLHNSALDVGIISSREEAIATILENTKHVEQRKTEILIEKPKENPSTTVKSVESKPSPSTKIVVQEKYHDNYATKDEVLSTFEKYCEGKIEPMLNKYKLEMLEKLETLKKNVNISENECMLYTQQVLREVEDLKAKEIKDVNEIESVCEQIKEDGNIFQITLKEINQVVASTSQMLVCLVENAQIDLALSAQEEEIRQEMSENVVLKPRQDSLQKKSMSFIAGHNIMQNRQHFGKISPLLYRSRKFNRGELVEMKGKMLKLCWDSVSKNIPWKQDEFEYVISEAVRSLKLISSEDSQADSMQPSKDSLPYVVSPSIRTKTPNMRKFKIAS